MDEVSHKAASIGSGGRTAGQHSRHRRRWRWEGGSKVAGGREGESRVAVAASSSVVGRMLPSLAEC